MSRIYGSCAVRWHGAATTERLRQAADPALADAAEHVLEEANRTIPHQTGHMEQTGRTHRRSWDEYLVSYDTPYAIRQHEDRRLRHAPGRRAEWLRETLRERAAEILRYLGQRIDEALR